MNSRILAICLTAGTIAATAAAQVPDQLLLVVDSSNNRVAAFDPFDGTLIDPLFIDLNPLGATTPKGIAQVGDEIWVSDQVQDRVDRFDFEGNLLGTIGGQVPGGGLDNVRGVNVIGDEVWVFNAGTNNDAPGNAIVRVDPVSATIIGNILLDTSPWFALPYNGENLVSYSGTTRIERFDDAGSLLGVFLGTGQLNFIQQMAETSAGTVLAAAFSSTTASGRSAGVWEIDANGNVLGIVPGTAATGPRAVWELGNGNVMWTNGSGVQISDLSSGLASVVLPGSGQFIALLTLDSADCYADFDGDGELTIFDFLAFQNAFATGDPQADCDGDGSFTLFDFLCFQNAFAIGCD